jgi:hypothetical protein
MFPMRHDEVNQEVDDHHISCSCSCLRHQSPKEPSCLRHRVSCSRRCCGLRHRPRAAFEAPKSLLLFEVPTRFLLLFKVKRHRQEQEALQHCFGALVIRCFGDLAPLFLEQGQEQEMWWSSASWLTSSCLNGNISWTRFDYISKSTMPQQFHNDATTIPQQFHMIQHRPARLSHLNGPLRACRPIRAPACH